MEERCVVCDTLIPEGRQVCPSCEIKYGWEDVGSIEKAAIKKELIEKIEIRDHFIDEHGKKVRSGAAGG